VVSAVVFAGCQHRSNSVSGAPVLASADASPNDAIRTAIQAHLAHNGNLSLKSFDTEVKQVKREGDHAQALVEFHVKNGPERCSLLMFWQNEMGRGRWPDPRLEAVISPTCPATKRSPEAAKTMGGGADSAFSEHWDNFPRHRGYATTRTPHRPSSRCLPRLKTNTPNTLVPVLNGLILARSTNVSV